MISTFVTEESTVINFPRLMRSIDNPGLIVLFANPGLGTVVSVGHGEEIHTVADISDDWDPEAFELFAGEVSLLNEADDGFGEDVQLFNGEDGDECNEDCAGCQDINALINGQTFSGSLEELLGLLGLKPAVTAGAARG